MRTSPITRTGLAASTATCLLLALTSVPSQAAALPMTLSSTGGPSGGGNPITASVTANATTPTPFPVGTQPTVQFQFNGTGSTACSAKARAVAPIAGTSTALTGGVLTVDPADVRPLPTTKIAFTVPSAAYPATDDQGDPSTINTDGLVLVSGQTSAKWHVCVYDSDSTTTSTLLANAAYTLAVRPKITAVLPATAPAYGGQSITVNGTGFSTAANATTVTIDNAPLTSVKVAANGNSLTAVTPAHAPGTGFHLVVRTAGGPVSTADPDNNGQPQDNNDATVDAPIPFSFSNGISVTPRTAPVGSRVSLDIRGVGFDKLTFSRAANAAPTDATAHVFLVQGAYAPGTNRGVQECTGVLVLGGNEIICTLNLGLDRLDPATSAVEDDTPVEEGTYTVTVVANGATAASPTDAAPTVITSGSTFTVAPY